MMHLWTDLDETFPKPPLFGCVYPPALDCFREKTDPKFVPGVGGVNLSVTGIRTKFIPGGVLSCVLLIKCYSYAL